MPPCKYSCTVSLRETQPLFSSTNTKSATEIDRLNARDREQEHGNILSWLSIAAHKKQQQDLSNNRQSGSVQWFLDTLEFKTWVDTNQSTLFCPGHPGTGKTFLSSAVIDHLLASRPNGSNTGVCYLYCNYKRREEQTPSLMVASLLEQLLQGHDSLPDSVVRLYYNCKRRGTRADFNECMNVMASLSINKIYVIVDAIDEYSNDTAACDSFLRSIFRLQSALHAHLLVTSRSIHSINSHFENHAQCHVSAHNEDLRRYVRYRFERVANPNLRNDALLQHQVESAIIRSAEGM